MTTERKEEFFLIAMCNFFGLGQESMYGLYLEFDEKEYEIAQSQLSPDHCWEDVLLQMLKMGYTLSLIDEEGDMDSTITLKDVHERMDLVPDWVIKNFEEENDDAADADALLQTIFYKEIIFG